MTDSKFNKIKFYVCHGIVLPFVLLGLYLFIVRDHLYFGAAFIAIFWGLKIYGDYQEWVVNGNRNSPKLDSGSNLKRRCCSCECHEHDVEPSIKDIS